MPIGFCGYGFVAVVLLLAPNLAILFWPPNNIPDRPRDGGIAASILEHAGRLFFIAATVFLACPQFTPQFQTPLFYGIAASYAIYLFLWVRYFMQNRAFSALSCPLFGIPVPMAVFPIVFMICAAIWLSNVTALAFAIVFAVGHITNSYINYAKAAQSANSGQAADTAAKN